MRQPRRIYMQDLASGDLDAQYVTVLGTVRTVSAGIARNGVAQTRLRIELDDGKVDVLVPQLFSSQYASLISSRVQVHAVVLCQKNDNMQLTGVMLAAPVAESVKVLSRSAINTNRLNSVPIGTLMRYCSATDTRHLVRVHGNITYSSAAGFLVIQDDQSAIRVAVENVAGYQPGSYVELIGYPALGSVGPYMKDAVVLEFRASNPQQAKPIPINQITFSQHAEALVSVNLRLLKVLDEPAKIVFLFDASPKLVTAEIDRANIPIHAVMPEIGSLLRVTGIDHIESGEAFVYLPDYGRSTLMLRSLSDIVVVTGPSFWSLRTTARFAFILGVAAVVFAFLALLNFFKRQKIRAVLMERQQMSHDIHDTLAQSFAGIGFQLQAIRRAAAGSAEYLCMSSWREHRMGFQNAFLILLQNFLSEGIRQTMDKKSR